MSRRRARAVALVSELVIRFEDGAETTLRCDAPMELDAELERQVLEVTSFSEPPSYVVGLMHVHLSVSGWISGEAWGRVRPQEFQPAPLALPEPKRRLP